MFIIKHDKDKCIGCGVCASVCSENWEMKGAKAEPKKTKLKEIGCNGEAADSCPVGCIHITEE